MLAILVPSETTNEVTNPRFAIDDAGYTGVGSATTRSTDRARFGRASGKVVTNAAAIGEGIYFPVNPASPGSKYAGSAYVRGTGLVRIRLRDQTTGLQWLGDPVLLSDEYWTRLDVIGVPAAGCADLRLYIETAIKIQSVTFYVDGFQIESGSLTTYADGDLEDEIDPHHGEVFYKWVGERNASASTRSARYREGGKVTDLTQGLSVNLYPTEVGGLGMPSVRLNTRGFASQEKASVTGARAQPRALTATFFANRSQGSRSRSLNDIHRARKALERVIKPDRNQEPQPFTLRHLNGGPAMDLPAHYEDGLGFSGDLRYPLSNNFALRMFAPDPYWTADSQDTALPSPYQSLSSLGNIVARIDGKWQALGSGANDRIFCMALAPNGDVYIGGEFTSVGGVANTARIARWDGTAWNALASGIDDGAVNWIEFDPFGDAYIAGSFTTINAVTYNYVARYDPDTDAFSVLGPGPGLDDVARCIAIRADGQVYFGGDFIETSDSLTTLNYVGMYDWDTDDWAGMGTGPGLDGQVLCALIDTDGVSAFFGGDFTDINGGGGGVYNRVIYWDGSAYSAMSTGMDTYVWSLKMAADGKVYASGFFSQAGYPAAEKAAVWNRKEWFALGKSGDGLVGGTRGRNIGITYKGDVIIVGNFTTATNSPLSAAATSWNGTRFSHLDFFLTSGELYAVLPKGDDLFIAGDFTEGTFSDASTVTNHGDAKTGVLLDIQGETTLRWIENRSTGQIAKLNLTIQDYERVLIDFRRGAQRALSSFRGNVIGGILPGSDPIELLPGENDLVAFFEGGDIAPAESVVRWPILRWSFDD